MSDIKWYTPTRQADGSYTVTVKASDHENANGRYEAQVFYIDARGQKRFVQKLFLTILMATDGSSICQLEYI